MAGSEKSADENFDDLADEDALDPPEPNKAVLVKRDSSTRMRIKQQAEERKASLKAKLEFAKRSASAASDGSVDETAGDEDTKLTAKLVNIASKRKTEYENAMSDKLPILKDNLDYDEAKVGEGAVPEV